MQNYRENRKFKPAKGAMDNSSAIYDNKKSECQQTDTNVIKMR